MVGVPRSRGCAACKQQKKKCSGGSEPPCVRCKRLDIPCIGLGERKLKFQDEGAKFILAQREKDRLVPPSRSSASTSTTSRSGTRGTLSTVSTDVDSADDDWRTQTLRAFLSVLTSTGAVTVPSFLSNNLTAVTSSYTRSISDPTAETNFGLIWSFGAFLVDVPPHLGRNEALDAAADGLAIAYDEFRRTARFSSTPLVIRKYSKALQALRGCLMTNEQACAPETLAAIMILMIFEVLIGVRDTRSLKHCDGAARVFRCRGSRSPTNELERKLLLTLRGPVVVQAYFVPESFFTDLEWKNIVAGFSLPDDYEEDTFFPAFAATARLFQFARKYLLLTSQHNQQQIQLPIPSDDPSQEHQVQSLKETLLTLRATASSIFKTLSDRLFRQSMRVAKVRELQRENSKSAEVKYAHSLYTRDYAMLLMTQIQINTMSAALARGLASLFSPSTTTATTASSSSSPSPPANKITKDKGKPKPAASSSSSPGNPLKHVDFSSEALEFESHNRTLIAETCHFAEVEGQAHRPLGSLYVGVMLHFAYAGIPIASEVTTSTGIVPRTTNAASTASTARTTNRGSVREKENEKREEREEEEDEEKEKEKNVEKEEMRLVWRVAALLEEYAQDYIGRRDGSYVLEFAHMGEMVRYMSLRDVLVGEEIDGGRMASEFSF